MNRRHLLAAIALTLAVSAPAFADSGTPHPGDYGNTSWYSQHHGPRPRPEVSAQVQQARKHGTPAHLRQAHSYSPRLELAPGAYRSMPPHNPLAGGGR
ncbi:DUF4148 domain-containing protein [Pseudomonas sp. MWU13-2625]|nr:DUF4148 domain-containing protein [Pseudomonas sp. MWU13-2625]